MPKISAYPPGGLGRAGDDFVIARAGVNYGVELFPAATTKTIAAGVLTIDQSAHKVSPQSGTTDDIDTISGMQNGSILYLAASSPTTQTLTFKHGTGNLSCFGGSDISLTKGFLICYYDGTTVFIAGGGGGSSITLSADSPRVYTSSGTWTKPAGLDHIIVEVIGGGGAGGGAGATAGTTYACGSGGGGGGYSMERIDAASLGATEDYDVGAGGTGVSGANGNAGGTSNFGTVAFLQATGGDGGVASAVSATSAFLTCAQGGIGSNGDVNAAGDAGMPGGRNFGSTSHGGGGGGTMMGGGGAGVTAATTSGGNTGRAYGGGGSGAANGVSQSALAGAAGAAGVVIVWEYVSA